MHRLLYARRSGRPCMTLFSTVRMGMSSEADFSSAGEYGIAPRLHNKPPGLYIRKVEEDPKNGYQVRVTYKNNAIHFAHYAQLGKPIEDPSDRSAQFDIDDRIYYSPTRKEYFDLLAVTYGKVNQAEFTTRYGAKISLTKVDNGFHLHLESFDRKDPSKKKICDIPFVDQHAAALPRFMDSTLVKYFDFDGTRYHNRLRDRISGDKRSSRHHDDATAKNEESQPTAGGFNMDSIDDW
uniref:Uncharacterized protein n=1 Tax=Paramoeba aestuarina TaxID=180227 RepID=A0A7S4JFW1_9EUKA|mmetsp:Transcript_100/g.210  ORF Transcript_100/g.210 Transcript_100/m.210 type:complete len:237 (+) Transcript_100:34-744(+)